MKSKNSRREKLQRVMAFIRGISIKSLAEGMMTFLPGCSRLLTRATSGTDNARYCYSVWLRHFMRTSPFRTHGPLGTIMELGPGDSIGIGLSALLTGAEKYIGIDVVDFISLERNRKILSDLGDLFSRKENIPGGNEFPKAKPHLDSYHFPDSVAQNQARYGIHKLHEELKSIHTSSIDPNHLPIISYLSPEKAAHTLSEESVNLIFSQAVLEHVEDLGATYSNCHRWLKPGGLMSHQIDFKSHGTSAFWNGHWTYPEMIWRLMKGNRLFLINRSPLSIHLKIMEHLGFEILTVERYREPSPFTRKALAKGFEHMETDDLTTASAYIIARKRG